MSGIDLNFSEYDYYLRVWSSRASFILNPEIGDIANVFFDVPTEGPNSYGQTGVLPNIDQVRPTYELRFNVSSQNISIPAGQDCVVAIQVQIASAGSSGSFGIVESTETGAHDELCTYVALPPNCTQLSAHPWRLHSGRLAVAVLAQQTINTVADGDMNLDGIVNGTDIVGFVDSLTTGTAPQPVVCHGDFSTNGAIDLADLPQFIDRLLE